VDGPATRPITSLAVKNSVGKPAAREAPNVGVGKESVAGEDAELLRRREVLIPEKLKFITRKSNLQKPI
jgi:hypothetical protein